MKCPWAALAAGHLPSALAQRPGGRPAPSLAAEAARLGISRWRRCRRALRTCHLRGMRCCRPAGCFPVGLADASGSPQSAVAAWSAPPELSY